MPSGIETTTGPLGQGLANAVGMALAERLMNAQFGDALVDHRTYVLASDGDLMEGISQEAIALAGHLRLNKLIVIFDDNSVTIDGPISLSNSMDQVKRFEAANWKAMRIDGHDPEAIDRALTEAKTSDRPVLIAAKTTIGKGAPKKAGTAASHGSPLGAEEIAGARKALGWTLRCHSSCRKRSSTRGARSARAGAARARTGPSVSPPPMRRCATDFERRMAKKLPAALDEAIQALKRGYAEKPVTVATEKRQSWRSTRSTLSCPRRSAAPPTSRRRTTPSRRVRTTSRRANFPAATSATASASTAWRQQ